MATLGTVTGSDVDWTACELIEQIPGKVSGRPVVRETRIVPDPIVNSCDLGDSVDKFMRASPPSLWPRFGG